MTSTLPRETDMQRPEVDAFLATRRYAAVATIDQDGSPQVVPSSFTFRDDIVELDPRSPSVATAQMSRAEAEKFLLEYRYPNEHANPPFVVAATRKRDGSPLAIPLGYLYEEGAFWLSINNVRTIHHRLRREPRIALSVFGAERPLQAAVVTGVAERVDDPGDQTSRRLFRRHMEAYPWLDFESYLSRWLDAGRTVYRVGAETLVGWHDDGAKGHAVLDAPEADPPAAFAAFSEEAPTVVVLFTGRALRREEGGYDLRVQARSAWDSNKQPSERWERGKGSHVEGGTWIPIV